MNVPNISVGAADGEHRVRRSWLGSGASVANEKTGEGKDKMLAAEVLQLKVESSFQKAHLSETKVTVRNLEELAREGFMPWAESHLKERLARRGSKDCTDPNTRMEELWQEAVVLVQQEGLKERVKQLERELEGPLAKERRANMQASMRRSSVQSTGLWHRVLEKAKDERSASSTKEVSAAGREEEKGKPQVAAGEEPAPATAAVGEKRGLLAPRGTVANIAMSALAKKRGTTVVDMKAAYEGVSSIPKGGMVTAASALMDISRLLQEIAAIWGTVPRDDDGAGGKSRRLTLAERLAPTMNGTMQNAIKTFYLRKYGAPKSVEKASADLCKAVLEHAERNLKVALFATVTHMKADEREWSWIQGPLLSPGRGFFQIKMERILRLPPNAASAMASLMVELKALIKSKKYEGTLKRFHKNWSVDGVVQVDDISLPFSLALAAGQKVLGPRSRATVGFFHQALAEFADFVPVPGGPSAANALAEAAATAGKAPTASMSGKRLAHLAKGVSLEVGSKATEEESPEALRSRRASTVVAHLIHAYLQRMHHARRSLEGGQGGPVSSTFSVVGQSRNKELMLEQELLDNTWRLLALESTAQIAPGTNPESVLGLLAQSALGGKGRPPPPTNLALLARNLIGTGIVGLPLEMVHIAFSRVCGRPVPGSRPDCVEVRFEHFQQLIEFAKNPDDARGDVLTIKESMAMWAGLCAFGYERAHEIELMGQLFDLFDASGDGNFQFHEFEAFMRELDPGCSTSEIEYLISRGSTRPPRT